MEKLYRELGTTVLEVLTMGLLTAFLFSQSEDMSGNKGILQIFKSMYTEENIDFSSYRDVKAAECFAQSELPAVKLNSALLLKAGEEYQYSDFFCIDEDCRLRIKKLEDASGSTENGTFDNETGKLCFYKSGKYSAELFVWNQENRLEKYKMDFAVNR